MLTWVTSKTKQFWETSSIFEAGNIKTKQFCETSFNNESWVQSWRPRAKAFCHFAMFPMCLKHCACQEEVRPGHTKCCTCHTKSSSQNWRSDAPNATNLRKSAPGPPNISDEHVYHVSCTAPATENASLQILFTCPTPGNAVETATMTLTLGSLLTMCTTLRLPRRTASERPKVVRTCCVFNILTWKCASRHNAVHFFNISTSKSGPL